MQFDSLAALWAMEGHGPYVWSAFGLTALVMMALVLLPLAGHRQFLRSQRAAAQRRSARQPPRG